MDLGLQGKWALVCAASKGLGKGCAEALAREGAHVVITARGGEALAATADELRRLGAGGEVRTVVGDIATATGRAEALAACPRVDILVNNAGGPPPGDFRQWDRDAWIAALDANMLAPIALIKATIDAMAARGYGRIVNITSSAVKAPSEVLGLSNGARSGLTGFRRRAGAQPGRRQRRDDQQPAAGRVRHRTPAQPGRRGGRPARCRHRHRARRATPSHSGTPARQRAGVRRCLRLPVQPASRLSDRPEHPARRRRLSRRLIQPVSRRAATSAAVAAATKRRCRPRSARTPPRGTSAAARRAGRPTSAPRTPASGC